MIPKTSFISSMASLAFNVMLGSFCENSCKSHLYWNPMSPMGRHTECKKVSEIEIYAQSANSTKALHKVTEQQGYMWT